MNRKYPLRNPMVKYKNKYYYIYNVPRNFKPFSIKELELETGNNYSYLQYDDYEYIVSVDEDRNLSLEYLWLLTKDEIKGPIFKTIPEHSYRYEDGTYAYEYYFIQKAYPYSGKLLLVADYIYDFAIDDNIDKIPFYGFNSVCTFVFNKGKLELVIDYSEDTFNYRRKLYGFSYNDSYKKSPLFEGVES